MARFLTLLVPLAADFLRCRRDLLLENLALRQQLATLSQEHCRPHFAAPDRTFWVLLRRFWSGWRGALVIVQPETVIRWHRTGFKLYWKWISRKHVRVGRKSTREMKQTHAIEFLDSSGFERKLIADILNTTSNTVSVSLSKSKAKKKSPMRRGNNKSQMKRRMQTKI